MCASVAAALENEFQRPLGSPGTYILDPCTGTGNFIAHLIQDFIPRRNLEAMYRSQLFANEVMLMPYYIASLNIEHAYWEKMGERRPFDGLCFVDTLDMAEEANYSLFTEENTARVQRQKGAQINVIIGNPPYNVGQKSENDNNKNRAYKEIDQRVRDTYSRASEASSKSKLNDAYVKFFRWATDRIGNKDGILCFVSNNGFLEQHAFDGMRQHLAQDFTLIDHIDLHGNVRKNPKLSGTTHNVFGIQVGVGITLAIRKSGAARSIRYHRVPEMWTKREKLEFVRRGEIPWQTLTPNAAHTWLIPENSDEFANFPSIADLFSQYSLGVCTHRDDVVFDFHRNALETRVRQFIENYNSELDRYRRAGQPKEIDAFVNNDLLKWSRDLKLDLKRGHYATFDAPEQESSPEASGSGSHEPGGRESGGRERRERVPAEPNAHTPINRERRERVPSTSSKLRQALYRPFTKRWLFFDRILNEEVYQLPKIFPPGQPNRVIVLPGIGNRMAFGTLASEFIPALDFAFEKAQCLPESHITDSALALFRTHYQTDSITRSAIFHYLYALLHHPAYRARYAEALKKELPRIPFAPDFNAFARTGERLMDLHINYESAKPYDLKWIENPEAPYSLILDDKMRLSKDRRSIEYNRCLTVTGIPPEAYEYRLGHRSALEWVIDQYRVKRDGNNQITSDPNRPDDPEYILRLVAQVINVSLETQRLVAELPEAFL